MKKTSRFQTLREYVLSRTQKTTQGQVARELGIAHSALSEYINNKRRPSRDTALRISKQVNIDLKGLLDPPQVRQ